ncbi:MAG: hypothetical protein AAGA48_12365 [Myxococcota bacterium]
MVRTLMVLAMATGCFLERNGNGTDTPDPGTADPTQPTDNPDTNPDPDPTNPDPDPDPDPAGVIDDLAWQHNAHHLGPFSVYWTQTEAATVFVEYQVDGAWERTRAVDGLKGNNEATVIGVPLGMTADWRVVMEDGSLTVDADKPLVARPADPDMPIATIDVNDATLWSGDYVLVSINETGCDWCGGVYWLFIIDRAGRPVWATRTGGTDLRAILYAQISQSGDSILWDEIHWRDREDSEAHRTYLDEPIEDIDIPGHHHSMLELPDGTIAWAAELSNGSEGLLELAPGATAPTEVWSCSDWSVALQCFGGGSNSIWYDAATDSYVYSWWSMESVVEVDRASGTSTWWSRGRFSNDMIFDEPGEYGFEPDSSRFRWQHGLEILPNGNLLASTDENGTTWVREYEIDRTDEVLRDVWGFNSGEYAQYNGDTRRLPNGNTLHGLGARSQLYEVTTTGTVAWWATWSRDKMLGRAEIIDDLYDLVAP